MSWETHPVTPDRFEDFADVLNRSRRVNHCWCLSHRLRGVEIEQLGGGSREQAMRRMCQREHPPGVVTYRDGEPVGRLCRIARRARGQAYPVDPPGRMDLTMAFVGTKSMFERAGFRIVGTTDAVANGMARLVMRRDRA